MADRIVLPYKFTPRPYQLDPMKAIVPRAFGEDRDGVRRAVMVWHRRCGKDKLSINLLTMLATERVGNYLYMSPEITQTRKIIWTGIGKDGMRFIDHIPPPLIKRKTESDMMVELVNGSIIQLGGADAYDRQMGTNPQGIIFSEYSLMNATAWNYFRPILVENGGVAIFIFTPRGHNHAYDLFKVAEEGQAKDPQYWFCSHLTIEDTRDNEGRPIITQAQIEQEIEEGMPSDLVEQEFFCSFDAGQQGAYYADLMAGLDDKGHIGDFPHRPDLPVFTAWDLGLGDANAIWFAQHVDGAVRVIDYEEDTGVPLSEWVKIVKDKPYVYHAHFGPHDLEHREYTSGKTRLEIAGELGISFEVVQKLPIKEGISTTREFLPGCRFNEPLCEQGLNALMNYTKVFDEKLSAYRDTPRHDWASNGADAFRQLAVGWEDGMVNPVKRPRVITSQGQPRGYWRKPQHRGGYRL